MGWLDDLRTKRRAGKLFRIETSVVHEYVRHPTMSIIKRELRGELGDPGLGRRERHAREILDAHDGVWRYVLSKLHERDRELLLEANDEAVLGLSCVSTLCRPEGEDLYQLVVRTARAEGHLLGRVPGPRGT
jgi:hypothetical protein